MSVFGEYIFLLFVISWGFFIFEFLGYWHDDDYDDDDDAEGLSKREKEKRERGQSKLQKNQVYMFELRCY